MDKRSFEAFYQANLDRIYRYVFFRVGRNETVTQDIVSEIFIKALQHFEKYDEAISRSAWIYRIAHNHLANYFRDKKPQVDLEDVSFTLVGEDGRRSMENGRSTEAERAALGNSRSKNAASKHSIHRGYAYAEMAESRTIVRYSKSPHIELFSLRSL